MASWDRIERSAFTNEPFQQRVEKPWGYEIIFTPPGKPYCGKVLHIEAGKRLSLQYHDQKLETVMLLSGAAMLLCDDDTGTLREITMQPGMGYSNIPGQRHRLIALETCDILEASSPESGTTYRLEDDAHRPHETESLRAQERG